MKVLKIILAVIVVLALVYFVGTGFSTRSDVYLATFNVSPSGDEMTISVGVASSMGYTRAIKNTSDSPEEIKLKCYSAFGGLNSSIGAKSTFKVPISPETEQIYLYSFGEYRQVLQKDAKTGEWQDVRN